jgi:hypothetical protein
MQSFYGNIRVKGVIHSLSVCLSLNGSLSFRIWAYSLLLVHTALLFSTIRRNRCTDLYITLRFCVCVQAEDVVEQQLKL